MIAHMVSVFISDTWNHEDKVPLSRTSGGKKVLFLKIICSLIVAQNSFPPTSPGILAEWKLGTSETCAL